MKMVKYLGNEVGGLKVNHKDINLTVENGQLEMMKYLYDKGLEVYQSDIRKWSNILKKSPDLKLNIPEKMKIIFDNFLIFN